MFDDQHRRFRHLIDQGYSSLDAADELGLTAAQREEALDFSYDPYGPTDDLTDDNDLTDDDLTDSESAGQTPGEDTDDLPGQEPYASTHDGGCFTATPGPVATIEAALDHLREQEARLARDREALEAERLALADERAGLSQQVTHNQTETYEGFRHRSFREKVVSRFSFLLDDLLDNSEECRWSGPEVDDYLERCDSLAEKLTKYCDSHRIDERRLVMYQGLADIVRTVAAMQHEQTKGLFATSSVVIDFGPKTRQRFESYRVSEFLTEAPATGEAGLDLDDDDDDN